MSDSESCAAACIGPMLKAGLCEFHFNLRRIAESRDAQIAALRDEVRRLDTVILEGRTIIYDSAFYDEQVGDQYRYPRIRAWVVSAIPVREALRALEDDQP